MAAMSEARVAMMNAAASGPKNFPCSPDNSSIGVRTSTTTKVAYTTGALTSMAASNTISRTGRARSLRPRSRLTMFSTSMIASSTTTPSATARPPRVIVLIVQPNASTTITVVSTAMGIVANVTTTLRKSRRNKNRTIVISTVPMSTSRPTPLSAFSMKLAGRWRLG